jgi:hypothetical protein
VQTSKALLILSSCLLVLSGCASNYADESKDGKPTMMELHQAHIEGMYGNKIEKSREHFEVIDSRGDSLRNNFTDDLRLPNPELEFVVFPKRNSDGSVQPQQNVKFGMYRQVHYKVGQL